MTSLLTNLSIIQQLSRNLIRGKPLNYSQECILLYNINDKFSIENIEGLKNPSGYLIKATLIRHKSIEKHQEKVVIKWSHKRENTNQLIENSKCIVFLHGLGSNRLEAMPLLDELPKDYCLFLFDFNGSGKSEGQNITYGLREAEDMEAILQYLKKQKGIKQFVIWGRSMGAVAALIFCRNLFGNCKNSIGSSSLHGKIKGLVIDSPFGDFQEITKQIALKQAPIPEFLIQFALSFIKNSFDTMLIDETRNSKIYNPFSINLGSGGQIETGIPTIFLYSQSDEVVKKQHSEAIIKNYKGRYERIVMENVGHNQIRPSFYLQQIFINLNKLNKKSQANRRRCSLSTLNHNSSLNTIEYQEWMSKKRGISVESKSKHKKSQIKNQQLNMLQVDPTHYQLNLKKSKILTNQPTLGSEREQKNNSPLKLRLSNSLRKQKLSMKKKYGECSEANVENVRHKLKMPTGFYNTIDYSNADLVNKKLYKDGGREKMQTIGGRLGHRARQSNKKIDIQLTHTRYL